MTKNTTPRVKVTQADREAVYDLARQGMLSGTRVFEAVAEAFARHRTAAHEPEPVDPLEQAVDDAFCLLPPEWTRETFVKSVSDALRARGVTVAKGGE